MSDPESITSPERQRPTWEQLLEGVLQLKALPDGAPLEPSSQSLHPHAEVCYRSSFFNRLTGVRLDVDADSDTDTGLYDWFIDLTTLPKADKTGNPEDPDTWPAASFRLSARSGALVLYYTDRIDDSDNRAVNDESRILMSYLMTADPIPGTQEAMYFDDDENGDLRQTT